MYVPSDPAGWLDVRSADHIVRLSGWVRDQNSFGIDYPNITLNESKRIKAMPLPGFQDRADRALRMIARRAGNDVETSIPLDHLVEDLELLGRSYSKDSKEAATLVHILESEGSVRQREMGPGIALSVEGLLKVEGMSGNQRMTSSMKLGGRASLSQTTQAR
jgi:hypothetical protein